MANNDQWPLPISTNEELKELTDKDLMVEIVGWVDEISAPSQVGSRGKTFNLYKFVLTNGDLKVQCLVWGAELIDKYVREITPCRVLHIEGAQCKAVQKNFQKNDEKFLPYEIIIQQNTTIEFYGTHQLQTVEMGGQYEEVDFTTIVKSTGRISISGYVKIPFTTAASRTESSTFGLGALTDGIYKITVQIANFNTNDNNFVKGDFVTVRGMIKENLDHVVILCQDLSNITLVPGVDRMAVRDLYRGVRTPKRLREEN